MAALRWILVALACACTTQQSVLAIGEVRSCETAFEAVSGTPCSFTGTCERDDPTDPACCSNTSYCNQGSLVINTQCNPDCSACTDDVACEQGAAICVANRCTPCPSTAGCPACPPDWTRLPRNGCETCECAPMAECAANNAGTPNLCINDPNAVCYPGQRCAAGCAESDLACCTSECAAQGCSGETPVGCLMQCPPNMQPQCNQCAAESCSCVQGAFVCTPRCVDGFAVQANCIAN